MHVNSESIGLPHDLMRSKMCVIKSKMGTIGSKMGRKFEQKRKAK